MEGAHRELRSRLANGLRGNDTHRLTMLGWLARGKVATITTGANTITNLAGEHRAHFYPVQAHILNLLRGVLKYFLPSLHQFLIRVDRIEDIITGVTAYETGC